MEDLKSLLVTTLHAERYYLAHVDVSIEEGDERRSVIFDVTRGPKGERVRLSFSGNEVLDDRALADALPRTDAREFFFLLERPAELERGIRLRYAADGYLDASTGTPSSRFDALSGVLEVEVPVEEGALTTIVEIQVDPDLSIDSEKLLSEFGVDPGTPVDFPEIRRGQTRLRTLYRNEGFPDVKVRAALERSESGLNVRLLVEEGGRARVGDVVIVGNVRTHPSVIRNELTFRTNDPVRLIDFQETQKRLYDLGIYRSADVRPDPAQAGRDVQDIVIQVVERADLDVNYGLRYNAITSEQSVDSESEPRAEGLEATARVNFINQFGRGTNLGFSIFYASNRRLFRGTFRLPTLLGRRVITELIAETEQNEDRLGLSDFQTRSNALTFQQTKKLTDNRYEKFALQWNFRFATFTGRRFTDGATLGPVDTNRPRFGVSLIEDRRDSFANPTRGRFWNVTLQGVPEAWGSDVGYIRLYGQFFYYYPIKGALVWASGVRLGAARGTKTLLLMEDRFLAGGANSVRGFKQNSLGPSVVIPETQERIFIGGQAVAVLNQELRFPIYKALHGGVYVDAGNVFTTASQMRIPDMRVSAGAGLRFALPFGAIRFDWAEALNPDPFDETVRWHFSFGYAF